MCESLSPFLIPNCQILANIVEMVDLQAHNAVVDCLFSQDLYVEPQIKLNVMPPTHTILSACQAG